MKRRMNRKNRNRLLFAAAAVIVLTGILLPGQLLIGYRELALDQVAAAPAEYYSAAGSAMARNASAKLGVYQKLQLITGKWESSASEAASYEMDMEDYEAAAAARESLNELYACGLYVSSLSAEYGNWYTWEAKRRKAVDAVFQTYTAYYWEITFSRYDGAQSHTVRMLEDGTVFLAEAEFQSAFAADTLTNAADVLSGLADAKTAELDTEGERPADWIAYSGADTDGMQLLSLTEVTEEDETCIVVQAYSDTRYLYAVVPQ